MNAKMTEGQRIAQFIADRLFIVIPDDVETYIDALIAEHMQVMKVDLETLAHVVASTETKHHDHNYIADAKVIAKAVLDALIEMGVGVRYD